MWKAGRQEIVIDIQFEKTLCGFMKHHWSVFDDNNSKEAELKVFHLYRAELQNYLQKVGSMTNQEMQALASRRIAETLELLEMSGMSKKEIDIIRKAMWRLLDEFILIKKVGNNDKITK